MLQGGAGRKRGVVRALELVAEVDDLRLILIDRPADRVSHRKRAG